jgi:2-dehydropantoate 2-reductase
VKVLVFGAGGIGSVMGGFLARTGHDVSLIGRSWHLDVIAKQGLTITGIWGDYRMKAFDLYRSAEELKKKNAEYDLILLSVKSYDTARAMDDVLPLMTERTTLISFQNGLGNIETVLEKGVKPEDYLVGRVIFGVDLSPGIAKITVNADDVRIGALPGIKPKLGDFKAAQLFNAAKVPTQAVPDILTYVWSKVIYNCALNGICSLHQMPYGDILKNDETKALMEEVVKECYAVGLKKGIALNPLSADDFIVLLKNKLIPSTASHTPSMMQDLKRGRRTEIAALNGAIRRFGEELGIPTPANKAVEEGVLARESAGTSV